MSAKQVSQISRAAVRKLSCKIQRPSEKISESFHADLRCK